MFKCPKCGSDEVNAEREMRDVTMGGFWGPASTKREYIPGPWTFECRDCKAHWTADQTTATPDNQ